MPVDATDGDRNFGVFVPRLLCKGAFQALLSTFGVDFWTSGDITPTNEFLVLVGQCAEISCVFNPRVGKILKFLSGGYTIAVVFILFYLVM